MHNARLPMAALLTALLLAGCGGGVTTPFGPGRSAQVGALSAKRPLVKPLVDQEAIFPAARELIAQARSDIQIDMFFMGGAIGLEFAELLLERKRAGVDVKFLYDPGMGYHAAIKDIVRPVITKLAAGGIETRPFPIKKLKGAIPVKADHNKMLLVDGRIGMVGGMNFADCNAPNHDLMLQVEGPSVLQMKRNFKQNWVLAGGRETDLMGAWQVNAPASDDVIETTASGLVGTPTRPRLNQLIDGAQKRIWLQMFILADDRLCDRLLAASRRGVDVRVIMDPNKFAFALDLQGMPNLGAALKFQGSPVKVRLYDTAANQQMHIKMCLFDDDLVTAGSTNWTQAGLDTNNETALVVKSPRLNRELSELFERDWDQQDLTDAKRARVPWFRGTVADLISFLF